MKLRMKNLNIIGVHRKIWFLGLGGEGGDHKKPVQKGGGAHYGIRDSLATAEILNRIICWE